MWHGAAAAAAAAGRGTSVALMPHDDGVHPDDEVHPDDSAN